MDILLLEFQFLVNVNLVILGQQLGLRLEQLIIWPWQYILWATRRNKKNKLSQARYIGFYNLLWLIANDLILGFAISAFILNNNAFLINTLDTWIMV